MVSYAMVLTIASLCTGHTNQNLCTKNLVKCMTDKLSFEDKRSQDCRDVKKYPVHEKCLKENGGLLKGEQELLSQCLVETN